MADKRSKSKETSRGRQNMYVVENGEKVRYIRNTASGKKRRYGDGGVVFGLALAALLIYIGGFLYNFLTREKIPETVVVYGSIEPVQVFSGVIIREETVYRSPAAGSVYYYKNDFDKIAAGGTACGIQDDKTVSKLTETINNIENNILNAQEGKGSNPIIENEKKAYNNQIAKAVDDAAMLINASDISAMYALTETVGRIVDYRNQLLFSENRGNAKTLSNELSIYQNQLNNAISTVKIDTSGIISYKTDGLEEILTLSRIKELSVQETGITANLDDFYAPGEVGVGDPIFKIVTSNEWYIASYIPAELTDGWVLNMLKPIYADDGNGNYKELETRIYSIERTGSGMYVVFKCTRNMTDFLEYRSVTFKIKKGLTEGLKIPNSAIVEKTLLKIPADCVVSPGKGPKYVLKRVALPNGNGSSFEQVLITVYSSDDDYVSVITDYNNISRGDFLLLPKTLGEVVQLDLIENVKGVYVTNTGSAVFRKIVLSGEMYENLLYTIIDPALNPFVKVSDRIVSDAKYVEEKQFVY